MKPAFLLCLALLFITKAFGSIDPVYKECMQRGYYVEGNYCTFPDSSRCLLTEFNAGRCGQQFMTVDYCVKEGEYIWDRDRCCEGLEPYSSIDSDKQATCRSSSSITEEIVVTHPITWIFLVAVLVYMGYLSWKKSKE